MFATRVMALTVLGGLMIGCQQQRKAASPSMPAANDPLAQTMRAKTYRSAHPGSEVGVVNAALPDRQIISIDGLPASRINIGDGVTILGGNGKTPIGAIVYDQRAGFTQARYETLPRDVVAPMVGDLAVWYPANAGTPLSPVTHTGALRMAPTSAPMVMPETTPSTTETAPKPDVLKKEDAVPAAPATMPASMPAASTEPAATITPAAAPMPTSRPVFELNK